MPVMAISLSSLNRMASLRRPSSTTISFANITSTVMLSYIIGCSLANW